MTSAAPRLGQDKPSDERGLTWTHIEKGLVSMGLGLGLESGILGYHRRVLHVGCSLLHGKSVNVGGRPGIVQHTRVI